MRKFALLPLMILPLFAGFFPSTIETTISKIDTNTLSTYRTLPQGMSGIVIHRYNNELEAITHRVVQTSSGLKTIPNTTLQHAKLPTIKTPLKKGDKVIGGYLYNTVLLLAPTANTYARITSQHPKQWIHPDRFALFLNQRGEQVPTRLNLKAFAQAHQVGLVYIVTKGKAKLLDPISGRIVKTKSLGSIPTTGKFPFFMRFDKLKSGWFSKGVKGDYYTLMENL